MKPNRRTFVRTSALSLAVATSGKAQAPLPGGSASVIQVNQLGFLPGAGKFFAVANPPSSEFIVQRVTNPGKLTRTPVFEGRLKPGGTDLGPASIGDFSAVTEEGIYWIVCGNLESRHVTIYRRIYDYPLRVLYNYFPSQRCGDSRTGYNAPCHLTDARRVDTGKHVDVTGGWHMSCDLRKWILGTPFALLGLTRLGEQSPRWDEGRIDQELRWGNQYFLRMIRADGGLMDHVVLPLGWKDERQLYANDAPLPSFHLMIVGQAMMAHYYRQGDRQYSRTCREAAVRLWTYAAGPNGPKKYSPPVVPPYHNFLRQWFDQHYPGSALALGDGLLSAVWLYRATSQKEYLEAACRDATALVNLQVGGDVSRDPVAACFRESPGSTALAVSTYYGFFGPLGLCELLELAPHHPDRERWLDAIQRIAAQYCLMSDKNAWGLIPCYWYASDPGSGRPAGSGYYKYFYQQFGLRLGVNQDVLEAAIFLLRAYRLTKERRYLHVAGRQIDWILGGNPFDISSAEGIGYNQQERLISAENFPPTPQIPGAVMTGFVGDKRDAALPRGSVSTEYDMPPTSLLIWLMAEMQDCVNQN